MIPTILIVSMVAFSVIMLLPGDPALAILGESQAKDQVAYESLRKELGLDRPLPIQYLEWVTRATRGDLGMSIRDHQPVVQGILARLPATVLLAFSAMVMGVLIAIPAGIVSAIRPNSKWDVVGTIACLSGVAIPPFWLGIVLVFVMAVMLRWLPPTGFVSPVEDPGQSLRHLIMPMLTLSTGVAAVVMRQARSTLIEVMQADFITTAHAKGLKRAVVVYRHAVKNALIPVVTVIGLHTSRLLGGVVVVESVFAIPGIGQLAVNSIYARDFPMVQGVILFMAMAVLVANLVTDVLYAYLDPRIKYQ